MPVFQHHSFSFFYLLFHDTFALGNVSLNLAIVTKSNNFRRLSLLLTSLCDSLFISLSCALALTPEAFTWPSSPDPEQIVCHIGVSAVVESWSSLLRREPQHSSKKVLCRVLVRSGLKGRCTAYCYPWHCDHKYNNVRLSRCNLLQCPRISRGGLKSFISLIHR